MSPHREPRADATLQEARAWDDLLKTTGDDSRLTGLYLAFIVLACLIAAAGLVSGSAVTIVGAMVVSPDFGPLAAMAVGAVIGDGARVRRAATALLVGFGLAMAVTAAVGLVLRAGGWWDPHLEQSLRAGELAFVYQVGPLSWAVAALSGVAGILALSSEKSGTLVGVFISVTTIPAAACCALAVVAGSGDLALSALLQLLANLTGVFLAAVGTVWVRREELELRRHTIGDSPAG